jgi:hypothetical protein
MAKSGKKSKRKRRKSKPVVQVVFPKNAFESTVMEVLYDNMAWENYHMDEKRKPSAYIR